MVLILDNSRCLTETQHQTSSVHRQPQSDDGPDKKKEKPNSPTSYSQTALAMYFHKDDYKS